MRHLVPPIVGEHRAVVPPGKSLLRSIAWIVGGLLFLALGAIFPVHYTIFALAPIVVGLFGVFEWLQRRPSVVLSAEGMQVTTGKKTRSVAWSDVLGTSSEHSIHGRDAKTRVERWVFVVWLRDGSRLRFNDWLENLSTFIAHVQRATEATILDQLTTSLGQRAALELGRMTITREGVNVPHVIQASWKDIRSVRLTPSRIELELSAKPPKRLPRSIVMNAHLLPSLAPAISAEAERAFRPTRPQ